MTRVLVLALMLSGCATPLAMHREHEIEGVMPNAQGLGAFAGSCLLICLATAVFVQGEAAPRDAPAKVRSKLDAGTQNKE